MHTSILDFIKEHDLCPQGSTVILGLSGGPDSIFLLHILAPLHHAGTITLITAHLDHGWRQTSAADAQFCVSESHKVGIMCIVEKLANVPVRNRWNGSQEEWGRHARRTFLEQVAHSHHADRIALGHHAQDQQETFFIRIIRASSIAGLACMKPHMGMYIRPLLETAKTDILTYLHTHHIPYLTDETNESSDYLRNRIRHAVLPAIRSCDPRFDTNFAMTLSRLQLAADFLQHHAKETLHTISTTEHATFKINIAQLSALSPVLQHHVIMTWLTTNSVPFTPTQAFFDELMRFATQANRGIHQIHTSWALIKKKGWIWIQK